MKKFFGEFKAFISKGDVVSMAVGLMVGSAFTAIITALNANILTPLLGIILGGINFETVIIKVGSAEVGIGLFIQAIINFLITALVLFNRSYFLRKRWKNFKNIRIYGKSFKYLSAA